MYGINFLLQDLKTNNVKLLVRTCEKTYDEAQIRAAGIEIHVSNKPQEVCLNLIIINTPLTIYLIKSYMFLGELVP